MADREPTGPEVIRLFPSFVWKSLLPAATREIHARDVLALVSRLRAGMAEQTRGEVWQSRHGLHLGPDLAPLVQDARRGIQQVLDFLRIGPRPFEITGLWVNVAAPGAGFAAHNHPNNFLSGVYYVRVAPGADTIAFHDPRAQTAIVRPPVTELTAYNTDQVVVPVEEGTMVIFPAWLVHSVEPNRSDGARISASFNAMFVDYEKTMAPPLWGEP